MDVGTRYCFGCVDMCRIKFSKLLGDLHQSGGNPILVERNKGCVWVQSMF